MSLIQNHENIKAKKKKKRITGKFLIVWGMEEENIEEKRDDVNY